jgi:hypothetical protein
VPIPKVAALLFRAKWVPFFATGGEHMTPGAPPLDGTGAKRWSQPLFLGVKQGKNSLFGVSKLARESHLRHFTSKIEGRLVTRTLGKD